jgi:hypothetical protein
MFDRRARSDCPHRNVPPREWWPETGAVHAEICAARMIKFLA